MLNNIIKLRVNNNKILYVIFVFFEIVFLIKVFYNFRPFSLLIFRRIFNFLEYYF